MVSRREFVCGIATAAPLGLLTGAGIGALICRPEPQLSNKQIDAMIQAMINADMRCAFEKAHEHIMAEHWGRIMAGAQVLGCG